MSSTAFNHLKSQIMTRPESERAELAHDLIESLDAPCDNEVSSEWEREIEKRIAQVDAGSTKLLDRKAFRQHMESRLKG